MSSSLFGCLPYSQISNASADLILSPASFPYHWPNCVRKRLAVPPARFAKPSLTDCRRWAFPFVVIGLNAVAIYMAGTLVPLRKIVGIFTGGIAAGLGPFGALFQAIAVLVAEWLILYWMYRRKIFLTA